jgi:hypothetical protein
MLRSRSYYFSLSLDLYLHRQQFEIDGLDMSTTASRPRRLNRRLPKRFRDLLPQAPPYLLPFTPATPATPSAGSFVDVDLPPQPQPSHDLHRSRRTERNVFGISRVYETTTGSSLYNPEDNLILTDFSDICPEDSTSVPSLYPFPNQNSFLLGEWFWSDGVQKSQQSFKKLLNIVGDPNFKSSDIRNTRWDDINHILGSDHFDCERSDDNTSWTNTAVTFTVPYQSRRGVPSTPLAYPHEFTVPGFHHRNLVSIIHTF